MKNLRKWTIMRRQIDDKNIHVQINVVPRSLGKWKKRDNKI